MTIRSFRLKIKWMINHSIKPEVFNKYIHSSFSKFSFMFSIKGLQNQKVGSSCVNYRMFNGEKHMVLVSFQQQNSLGFQSVSQ